MTLVPGGGQNKVAQVPLTITEGRVCECNKENAWISGFPSKLGKNGQIASWYTEVQYQK